MEISVGGLHLDADQTQLDAIRDLMLRATTRGDWLTLGEIAGHTEFGEASISAQLRHLRKRRHGGYRVEKRRRQLEPASGAPGEVAHGLHASGAAGLFWEYQVFPPGPAWRASEQAHGECAEISHGDSAEGNGERADETRGQSEGGANLLANCAAQSFTQNVTPSIAQNAAQNVTRCFTQSVAQDVANSGEDCATEEERHAETRD